MVKNANVRQILPKFLYKYYPLFDNEEKSNQRLNSIRQSYFWLASYWEMNDPTEYNFYLKKDELFEPTFFPYSRWVTTCFSKKGYNLPMWSHYSNNHKGFCVKFEVNTNHVNIYRVQYCKAKYYDEIFKDNQGYLKFKKSLIDFNAKAKNMHQYTVEEMTKFTLDFASTMISNDVIDFHRENKILLCLKHFDWRYEQEYRIIVPDEFEFCNENLLPFENSFLDPIEILIGMNIEEKYEKELKDIANHLGIGAKKIKLQDFYK